jgi:hypothetical protein
MHARVNVMGTVCRHVMALDFVNALYTVLKSEIQNTKYV